MIALWKFEEESGSPVHDSSSYGNHGAADGPDWVPGLGTALDVRGTDVGQALPPGVYLARPTIGARCRPAWAS